MLYFWIVFCSIIGILMLAAVSVLWVSTVIYIYYAENSFRINIRNIFFRYNYPSRRGTKEKKYGIKGRIGRFIKKSVSDSSEDSEVTEGSEEKGGQARGKKSGGNKETEKNEKSSKGFDRDKLDNIIFIKDIIVYLVKYLKYKLNIKRLKLSVEFGSGDAADTGAACGAFWAAYGVLLPALRSYFSLSKPEVSFIPRFNAEVSEICFESIIQVKLGHIINAVILSAIRHFRKR